MKTYGAHQRAKREAKNYDELKRGFMSIEYAFLIAIVVAAVIGMSFYIRRAFCGKWREAGDMFGQGRQFDTVLTKINDGGAPPTTPIVIKPPEIKPKPPALKPPPYVGPPIVGPKKGK